MIAKVYMFNHHLKGISEETIFAPTIRVNELENYEEFFPELKNSPTPIDFNIEVEGCEDFINFTLTREDAKFLAKSILNIIEK